MAKRLRVTAGSKKGRLLTTVAGQDVRPTTGRVKEAMFSILQDVVSDARVLDLFCGSGSLGIEALSRGANMCVFVDRSKRAVHVTTSNVEVMGFSDRSRVIRADVATAIKRLHERFDIIFADPPYHENLLQNTLTIIDKTDIMNTGCRLMIEHASNVTLGDAYERLIKQKTYQYGHTHCTVYHNVQKT